MSTHNICFHGEMRKITVLLGLLFKAILSKFSCLLTTNLKCPK